MQDWKDESLNDLGTADGRPRTASGRKRSAVRRLPSAVLTALLLLAACDGAAPEAVTPQYVVEAYLVAGELLPPVRLGRTVPLDSAYVYTEQAVGGAQVTVEAVDAEGRVQARYPYIGAQDTAGVYVPTVPVAETPVRPLQRYRLHVRIPTEGGAAAQVTASTVVPDTFRILRVSARDVVYRQPEQVGLTLTPSTSPGRAQAYYVLTASSLLDTLRAEALTPLYAELAAGDDDLELGELRTASSPVLNEANYAANPDGTLRLRVPWLAIAFYGPNRIGVSVVDDNLYDYLRSQQVQQGGGSTFAPGEIPNIIEHVEGGTGVFGSMAQQHVEIVVRRPGE